MKREVRPNWDTVVEVYTDHQIRMSEHRLKSMEQYGQPCQADVARERLASWLDFKIGRFLPKVRIGVKEEKKEGQ